jgi:hypothetical protein
MTNLTNDVPVTEREYRKTATIRATQWHKMGDHPAVVPHQLDEGGSNGLGWINTLEGGHIVTPGDWIATGVKGEHWPIKPDIFAASYEPAARLTSQPAQSDLVEAIKAIETALIEPDAAGAMAIVQQILADREAALSTPTAPQPDRDSVLQKIEQEYQWGNLTKVGVVNYLRRSGFNFNAAVRHAERIVPTMTDKLTQSAEAKDNLPIGCAVGTGSGTAMCSRGQPRFGGDCIYPECEDLTHPTTDTQSDAQSPTDREGDRLEWRPIESAPDNELVWCFEPHDEGGFIFAGMQQRGRRGWYNNLDFCDQNPTHWRPLPEAPAHLSRSIVGEGE